MAEKQADPVPKKLSIFRLVVDQARIDQDVLNYEYPGAGTAEDPYVVTWIPNDAGNPFNWHQAIKWTSAMLVATECFATAFASSAFSGSIRELYLEFAPPSTELITAGISLFVLGFAVGPLIWAPLSEIFGRQIVFTITFAAATAFNAASTGASNIGTLLVLRFFAGAFGSSPFTNGGGVIADIFTASERGLAMAFFALAPSMGPTVGPFIGGFTGENAGWKWVMGVMAIFTGTLWIAGSLLVPETYAPVLLRRRAAALSKKTGKVYQTKLDIERGTISPRAVILSSLVRPLVLLFMEPIVLILSIYMAIIYGTLYLLFGAYPIVFQVHRGWSEGVGGLAFLGVAAGMVSAIVFSIVTDKWYNNAARKAGGRAPPEARLPGSMIGAIAIPVGMFWFAWTNSPSIHWISPVAAGVPFGFGMTLVFLSITSYLIDSYTIFAASALAANTVLRSLFGAAFPLFTEQMFDSLGIHWASSIPAFLALVCVPFPFVFYKYGPAIRQKCAYASQSEKVMTELRSKGGAVNASRSTESLRTSSTVTDTTAAEDLVEEARFEPIKTGPSTQGRPRTASDPNALLRSPSGRGSAQQEAEYESSPYDIDRINTRDTVTGLDAALTRTRTNRSTKA